MKSIDRYYFFILKSASAPTKGHKYKYVYHEEKGELVRKGISDGNCEEGCMELPRLSTSEKLDIMKGFLNGLNNDIKLLLEDDLKDFDDSSELDFTSDLKSLGIYIQWDIYKGNAILSLAEKMYSEIGINERLKVVME